ncbi:hypothetical protein [Tenacibaculum sp. M341]|uniref:hypothetical protein n=1 Tax=Tenacibaculum sp. M341 TaxID=2530339 RepID=UPI0010516538|nr:hypothetical protein [Tenacibaculum sp. M341]TCI91833.1 hypothetical protein EYW44_09780 [Tenacibaculum sp. M341]
MKKTILNLGKSLNKTEQRSINGGNTCASYPICYGITSIGTVQCASCEEYYNLPSHCQNQVFTSCF